MGTTLDNGIYLPDEGERNCYDGLAGNWLALDNHLGSTDIHVTINDKQAWNGHVADSVKHVTATDKQAWNGHVADTTIHVTSADKQAWNGKADASALTAHTGDTTIHVTAEDKAKWDAVTSKADDSDVVHKSGNETISGNKTFSNNVNVYNSNNTATTPSIFLRNSKVTKGGSDVGNQSIFFTDKNNEILSKVFTNNPSNGATSLNLRVATLDNNADVSTEIYLSVAKNGTKVLQAIADNDIYLGKTNRWKDVNTYLVNGLEPSSLSLPDISTRIDISSYITNLNGAYNAYTPSVNGWIAIQSSDATFIRLADAGSSGIGNTTTSQNAGILTCMMPVMANRQINIYIVCTTLTSAYFIPCQGNA